MTKKPKCGTCNDTKQITITCFDRSAREETCVNVY